MTNRSAMRAALLFGVSLCAARSIFGQAGQPAAARTHAASARVQTPQWQITGHVANPHGQAIAGAEVALRIDGRFATLGTVETSAQGEFSRKIPVPGDTHSPIRVIVAASLHGYFGAQDVVELGPDLPSASVELVLRDQPEDRHLLAYDKLNAALLRRLRTPAAGATLAGTDLSRYQAAEKLLEQGHPEAAVLALAEVARSAPDCIECAALAGLAEFESGAWSKGNSELMRAAHQAASNEGTGRIPEPFMALGAIETWRGSMAKAAVFFLQALEIEPANTLALAELGRAQILDGKALAADHYLQKAIAGGAGDDVHLLRAEALLDLDKPREAKREMDQYLGDRQPKELPEGPRLLWVELGRRVAIESGGSVPTVVEREPTELALLWPELKNLEPASGEDQLPLILRKVGEDVQTLFNGFPDTSSIEEVRMESLHPDGRTADSAMHSFQYLLMSTPGQQLLQLSEYRRDKFGGTAAFRASAGRFMVTEGFASDPLIFHPQYQNGSTFRLLGRQPMDGRKVLVVAFAERPATAKMFEGFVVGHQTADVLSQGLAWIDPSTYHILRMSNELLRPAPEVRLEQQTTDVRFGAVQFKGSNTALWLPQQVSVTVHWNHRIFRNSHRYSDYRLFQVQTHQKITSVRGSSPASSPAPAEN